MAAKRWKSDEREIAKLLGGERVPVSGRQRGWAPDIAHKWLAPEVKSRISSIKIVQEMMDQAVKAAAWSAKRGEGDKLPMGIYHVKGTPFRKALVFHQLGDWREWFGDCPAKEES